MNPSCNPFSPTGQFQPTYGNNQPQNVNVMDQLMQASESLIKEQQRQQLMANMVPVLLGQTPAGPFQQGGGGGGGYRSHSTRDRPPLQCYHWCRDTGTKCNGPHLAKDCPTAAREREKGGRKL